MSFEINHAKLRLQEIKDKLRAYLHLTYTTAETAEDTYHYLERIVDKISKRQPYRICFERDGSPFWHAEVLQMLSEWIRLEHDLGLILTKALHEVDDST